MKKWEYEQVNIGPNPDPSATRVINHQMDFTGLINKMGDDGWELVDMAGNNIDGWMFLFKREKGAP